MPTHPHLVATFASLTPPPITPTTHHVGRPPPSHDDRRGNATSPIEQPATSMRGNNNGNPSCQMMDNDKVSPPSPLLFANPGARCHVSDMARSSSDFDPTQQDNNGQMDGDNNNDHDATQWQGVDTNSYKGSPPPPRRWPITTPSIGDEDPGPAPPHKRQQWPSTTPQTTTTAHTTPTSTTTAHFQHHPTNGEHGPAPPHEPAPTNDDNGPLSAPTDPL